MLGMSRRLWIPIVAVAALALLGSAGAYVYFFSGLRTSPPSLALASPGASPATDASANAGTWQIATGSVVGYRVKEQFVGQTSSHEAVARTGNMPMPSRSEHVVGGHAVLAVGYDDAQSRFRVRNSWGTDWGVTGYFTMPYAYLLDDNLSDDFWKLTAVS